MTTTNPIIHIQTPPSEFRHTHTHTHTHLPNHTLSNALSSHVVRTDKQFAIIVSTPQHRLSGTPTTHQCGPLVSQHKHTFVYPLRQINQLMHQSSFIMILSKSTTQSSTPLLLHTPPPRLTTSYLAEHRVLTRKQPHVASQPQMETNTNSFIHSIHLPLACAFSHPLPSNHTSALKVLATEISSLGLTS